MCWLPDIMLYIQLHLLLPSYCSYYLLAICLPAWLCVQLRTSSVQLVALSLQQVAALQDTAAAGT
jgi:hypothetical protein